MSHPRQARQIAISAQFAVGRLSPTTLLELGSISVYHYFKSTMARTTQRAQKMYDTRILG